MITLIKPKRVPSIDISAQLGGQADGQNKIFTTPNDYKSGKISLFYNGQTLHSPDDFLETGINEVTLIYIAPGVESVLRATYEQN